MSFLLATSSKLASQTVSISYKSNLIPVPKVPSAVLAGNLGISQKNTLKGEKKNKIGIGLRTAMQ